MIFSSLTFFIFFLIVSLLLLLYRAKWYRKTVLLAASYVFYGWWDARFLLLIIASSLIGYTVGIYLSRVQDDRKRFKILLISVVFDLGMLGFFKYCNFFIESFTSVTGIKGFSTLNIILPVGISFYTFQSMSYSIDVYRRKLLTCYNLLDFLLFIAFFPQLVAGPIVRAADFLPQLKNQILFKGENILFGIQVFLVGFLQKQLFADRLAIYADDVFRNNALYSTGSHWIAIIAYGLQIFCDFSGYSLMAIGSAKILGFDFLSNFNLLGIIPRSLLRL
jgi:alginate O-acetyltransferase complex protein AlgI